MSKINSVNSTVENQTIQPVSKPESETPQVAPLIQKLDDKSKIKELENTGSAVKNQLEKLLNKKTSPLNEPLPPKNPPPPPLQPADALKQINELPKPSYEGIPEDLPENERRKIFEQRVFDYNAKRAEIADRSVLTSVPPKIEDFNHLPPEDAKKAHQEALNTHNKQLAELKTISREAKVANLETNEQFKKLPPEVQDLLKRQIAKNENSPFDVDVLVKVGQTEGFNKLNRDEQIKFLNYVGGTNREISQPARGTLGGLLDSPKTDASNPEFFRNFLKTQPGLPWGINTTTISGEFDSRRRPFTISGPEDIKDFNFRGGTADAQRYIVEIDGKKIEVYLGKNQDPNFAYHSIEEIAKGLAALPKEALASIKNVVVENKQNPDDAYWEQVYGLPGFRSYMTAGAEGVISIYPQPGKESQSVLDASLIHEVGHILSQRAFGIGETEGWARWQEAGRKDGLSPSGYARSSQDEDFAETFALYMKVRGTEQESEIRALFPERFRLIDELLNR